MQIETTRRTDPTPSAVMALAIVLALLMPTAALAQQRKHKTHGRQGKQATRRPAATPRRYHDAKGRVTGRTHTGSDGTTTFYDAAGRSTGTVTMTKKSK